MADTKETKPNQEERKIPVFTVLKNSAILKNIFIVNNAQSTSMSDPKSVYIEHPDQENEEILIFGRHPDCNIMVTHPSISRFHLQIHSNPSSQKLHVVDLSSVHGTWLSEKKIEPGVRVEMHEGDTLRLGGSSRVYRLHWVPLSQAYEIENPFVSALDLSPAEDNEEEKAELQETNAIETSEEQENLLLVENRETQSLNSILECIESGFSEENLQLDMMKNVPSAPPLSEDMMIMSSFCYKKHESPSRNQSPCAGAFGNDTMNLCLADGISVLEAKNEQLDTENHSQQSYYVPPEREILEETGNLLVYKENQSPKPLFDLQSPNREKENKLAVKQKINILEEEKEDSAFCEEEGCKVTGILEEILPKAGEVGVLSEFKNQQSEKERYENFTADPRLHLLGSLNFECFDKENHCKDNELLEASGNHDISSNNHKQRELLSLSSAKPSLADVGVTLDFADNKKIDTPRSNCMEEELSETRESEFSLVRSENVMNISNIWSRRGKPPGILQIQTGRSKENNEDPSVEDRATEGKKEDNLILKDLSSHFAAEEGEIFTPDKENFTPDALLLKCLRKKGGKLEEIMHSSESSKKNSSKVKLSSGINRDENLSPFSDKENRTPEVLGEVKLSRDGARSKKKSNVVNRRADRIPFQSLEVNSPVKSIISDSSVHNAAARTSSSFNCSQVTEKENNPVVEEKRSSWNMVADISSLLNKETLKSLQLLRGLKGTQLIIPRMVIRELDSLKKHSGLLRKTTQSSSVLEWIKECMVNTKCWIYVESSEEEGRLTAPTPRSLPQSLYTESFMEMVSPTAEDHILDRALHFRKMKNEGQLVLLSNDVTLKIKAMAEGLICETAKEFRESLVNPFSERFLWADSSPRGLTWSYLDDVVLRERYERCCSLKKSSKAKDARGLKLILLHNSHYRK